MTFWVHSFKARREMDQAVYLKGERDIAKAVLAGWRFVEAFDVTNEMGTVWWTFDAEGTNHGYNDSREQAAAFALGLEYI